MARQFNMNSELKFWWAKRTLGSSFWGLTSLLFEPATHCYQNSFVFPRFSSRLESRKCLLRLARWCCTSQDFEASTSQKQIDYLLWHKRSLPMLWGLGRAEKPTGFFDLKLHCPHMSESAVLSWIWKPQMQKDMVFVSDCETFCHVSWYAGTSQVMAESWTQSVTIPGSWRLL